MYNCILVAFWGPGTRGNVFGESDLSQPKPFSSSDQRHPCEPWAAATLWPSVTWGLLLAETPKPQGKLGAERWFWRVK